MMMQGDKMEKIIQIATGQSPNDPLAKKPMLFGLGKSGQVYLYDWLDNRWMKIEERDECLPLEKIIQIAEGAR